MNRLHRHPLARYLRQLLSGLPKRAWLTLRYQGLGTFVFRALTFPLRLTPLGPRIGLHARMSDETGRARAWYRRHGRFVTIVIPTFGPPDVTIATVASLRRTVDPKRARILVVDDGSPPADRSRLKQLEGAEVIFGETTVGFASNANRGLRAVDGDVVLMNSDIVAHDDWLETLQFTAYHAGDVGIVGPKLLYEDGTIQSAGSHRNAGAPEWFDHRYRFRPAGHGPANVPAPAIAMTGACLYIRRAVIDRIGVLDERFGMAYEDVDYCLRAWEAGFQVLYCPYSVLTHLESKTRGMHQGERELASQRYFWEKWGDRFDRRSVRAPDGRLRVIYVTEGTGVGGGHRVVFEHLNRLAARGHATELYSLEGPPDWFPLAVPVTTFEDYDALLPELAKQEAIKVATWWNTADSVWRASVLAGIPVYLVQDIETSYYPDDDRMQHTVLASYREEFSFLTTSHWAADRLRELGHAPVLVAPGIDRETFRELGIERTGNVILAVGRSEPLKNFGLTADAWRSLPEPRAELWLYGIEPEVARGLGARYFESPNDEQVNELLNRATVFLQTSRHEGFCLPLLEAMAAGAPVVCTDAHGNRAFCRDGVNCLMVEDSVDAVCEALERLLSDGDLRRRLSAEGLRTAAAYDWNERIDELERYLEGLAG